MTIATQSKILRLLQEGEFQRVGGNETLRADVRVIAATNRNLKERIVAGTFREDLYYRLSVFAIPLPPLRDRKGDIPRLVEHFTRLAGPQFGKPIHTIPAETMDSPTAYDWPGNVRELQSAVKYAMVQATGEVFRPTLSAPEHSVARSSYRRRCRTRTRSPLRQIREQLASGRNDIYHQAQLEFDRLVLGEILRRPQGNQVLASHLLGISRTTLRAKLTTLGMLETDLSRSAAIPTNKPADRDKLLQLHQRHDHEDQEILEKVHHHRSDKASPPKVDQGQQIPITPTVSSPVVRS